MEATFLKEEQIWGDGALRVMKDYGTQAGLSDLAIVLGGLMGSNKFRDGQRTGYLWSASSDGFGYVRTVRLDGDWDYYVPYKRLVGARPALPPSVTSRIQPSEARLTRKIGAVQVVEYGEYPQTIAPEKVNKELEQALKAKKLQATGKKYTFDGEKYDAYDKPFKAKAYAEYQYNGKRYIRALAQPRDNDSVLSNGTVPKAGEVCWIEVQPIEWLVETEGKHKGWWVARQALFSGVQFDSKKSYDGNFDKTDMKQYLGRHFSKEMLANRTVDIQAERAPQADLPLPAPPAKMVLSTAFTGVRYHPNQLRNAANAQAEKVPPGHYAANMPVTPGDCEADARQAFEAGSRYFHLHARNPLTGHQSGGAAHYRECISRIKKAIPGVLISGPTSRKEEAGDNIRARMDLLNAVGKSDPSSVAQAEMARALPAINGGADVITMFTEPDILSDKEITEFPKNSETANEPRRWPATIKSYFNKLQTAMTEKGIQPEVEITHLQTFKTLEALIDNKAITLGSKNGKLHAVVLLGFSEGLPIDRATFQTAMEKLTALRKKTRLDITVTVGAVIMPKHAANLSRRGKEALAEGKHDYREVIGWVVEHNRQAQKKGLLPVSIFRTGLEDTPMLYNKQQSNFSLADHAKRVFGEYGIEIETDLEKVNALLGGPLPPKKNPLPPKKNSPENRSEDKPVHDSEDNKYHLMMSHIKKLNLKLRNVYGFIFEVDRQGNLILSQPDGVKLRKFKEVSNRTKITYRLGHEPGDEEGLTTRVIVDPLQPGFFQKIGYANTVTAGNRR